MEKSSKERYEESQAKKKEFLREEEVRNGEYDDKICRELNGTEVEQQLFRQGYLAAKTHYNRLNIVRLGLFADEEFWVSEKTRLLRAAEETIKSLTAECEFYSKCAHEIESHYLTRCVRFLQSFPRRVWRKLKRIFDAGKWFVKAFLPTRKGFEEDHRTPLYRVLQDHMNDVARKQDK